MYVDPTE
jgi:hypothetical protein